LHNKKRQSKCIFLLLIDLKSNFIKQYVHSCIVGFITYKNAVYLPIIGHRRWVEAKLYWTIEMTPDGNSNLQEQVKKTRSGK